ncbi:MAG: UDP-glucose 4-epimerase GalE [Casimicrobiaceae bacterium]
MTRDCVLVTGGAGFVGSHVVVELAQAGYAPVVLDDFSNSTPGVRMRLEALAGRPVPCITADVRDRPALRAAFHDHPIAAVVHCAGLHTIDESQARPLAFYDVNVGGTLSLVEVMGEAGVATIVFSSSAAVYGEAGASPVAEDAPLAPVSVNGRTQRVVEDFMRDLARANANWRIAMLRGFNAAGAHASGMLGCAPRGRPTDLLTVLGRVAAGEIAEAPICGDDWPTPDGTGVRDYIHVQDLAQLHVRALGKLASVQGAMMLNGGAGRGYSVREVIAAFERACGRGVDTRVVEKRAGDVAASVADIAHTAQVLDWNPARDLEAICADAWRWQKDGGHL